MGQCVPPLALALLLACVSMPCGWANELQGLLDKPVVRPVPPADARPRFRPVDSRPGQQQRHHGIVLGQLGDLQASPASAAIPVPVSPTLHRMKNASVIEGHYTRHRTLYLPSEGLEETDQHRPNVPTTPTSGRLMRRQFVELEGKAEGGLKKDNATFGVEGGSEHLEKRRRLQGQQFEPQRGVSDSREPDLDGRFHSKPLQVDHGKITHPKHQRPSHDLQGRMKFDFGVVEDYQEHEEPFFVDASSELPGHSAALRYGAAVADIDGSPDTFEVFIAGFGTHNMALKYDREFKRFVDFAEDYLLRRPGYDSTGVVACDMDGDGDEEIYVLNTDSMGGAGLSGDHVLNRNPKSGKFTDLLSEYRGSLNQLEPTSAACIDRFGTGRYSVATASYGTPLHLFDLQTSMHDPGGGRRQQRRSSTLDVASESGFMGVVGGRSIATGPILGSSRSMDILLGADSTESNGNVSLGEGNNMYFINQNGKFREVSSHLQIEDYNEDGRGMALLDADNDGLMDVMIGNWQGPHRLFMQRNNGQELSFTDSIRNQSISQPLAVRTVIVADFDNDGDDEVFFNAMEAENRMFSKAKDNGRIVWNRRNLGPAAEPNGFGTGAVVGDFDGDGTLELLIVHGEARRQKLTYYKVANPGRNFLRVYPKTQAGAPARGTKVTIVADGKKQTRIVDAGSGYMCVHEPVAHFGLGSAKSVDSVTVQFPNGQVKVVSNPPIRQTLEVTAG